MHAGFTISPDALDEELAVKEVSNRFLRGFGSVPAGHDERTSQQHKGSYSGSAQMDHVTALACLRFSLTSRYL